MNCIILPNVIETDFDDIKNIIKDRLKKEEIKSGFSVSWHDDSILISDMTEEAFQAILDEFLNLEIYGTPQFDTEEKLEKTEIEKVITEDGEGSCDSGSMDGALTTANVATYDSPFEIPTGFSKKQKAMFKRGVLEKKKLKENLNRGITISVREWFWDKLNETMKNYKCLIEPEYIETETEIGRVADHTKLRIADFLGETENAYKVVVEAETFGGNYKEWITWIPKSAIIDDSELKKYLNNLSENKRNFMRKRLHETAVKNPFNALDVIKDHILDLQYSKTINPGEFLYDGQVLRNENDNPIVNFGFNVVEYLSQGMNYGMDVEKEISRFLDRFEYDELRKRYSANDKSDTLPINQRYKKSIIPTELISYFRQEAGNWSVEFEIEEIEDGKFEVTPYFIHGNKRIEIDTVKPIIKVTDIKEDIEKKLDMEFKNMLTKDLRESRFRKRKIMKEKVFNIEVEAPTFEEIYIVENEYRWNWDEANEHARNHHFGYSDWRLPTVEELKWIAKNVEIDSDKEGWYWSSETCRYGEEDAYIVFLTAYGNGGDVEGYYKKYDDMNTLYVRGIDSETRDYLKLEKRIKKTTKESKKELNEGFKSYLTNLSDAFKEYISETSSKGIFTMKTLKDYLLSTFDSYKKYDKNDLTEIAKNFIDEWLGKKLIENVGYESYAFRDLKYESKTLKESELEFDLFDEFKKSAPKDFVIDDFIKFLKNFDETYKKYSIEELRDFAKDFIETWKDADLIDEIDNKKYRIKTIM